MWADFQMCINVRLNSVIAEKCYKQRSFISQMESVPFKEVRYNCSAQSFCAPFHDSNKQPHLYKTESARRIFLQYSCSVTMINIVKNICEGKFMN